MTPARLASDLLADAEAKARLRDVELELRELEDLAAGVEEATGGDLTVANERVLASHVRRLHQGIGHLRDALKNGGQQ